MDFGHVQQCNKLVVFLTPDFEASKIKINTKGW